ncbi:MAG TPA: serine/threonine-protein kinase [Gemmataceae bacterium]|nr:serine/threonine-protein kinase [Gemmataceae bacterium]
MNDVGSAHPSLDELTAFDRGHLQPAEREAVERHVAACDVCCQRLDSIGDDDLIGLLQISAGLMSPTASRDTCALPSDTPPRASEQISVELPAELLDHPRYRVLGPLGAGGMGMVFKAEHRLMERTVALKIIHKELTRRAESVERFRQEVKAAARLSHANIATAYDAEHAGDLHFLVMEYVEGTTLDQVVRSRGPLPVAQACDIARQASLGLQHAHERGMIHRDIKPQNLLLTPAGQVKILDFGLARYCRESSSGSLTAPGDILGTLDYLAPEQALDARQADVRADIYSLGCTLYFLLAGRPPFPDGSALQKLLAHQRRKAAALAGIRPDIPDELIRIVERLMAKEPVQRFQTASEVAEQLAPFAAGDRLLSVAARPDLPTNVADTSTLSFAGERVAKRAARRRWRTLAIAAAALLFAALLGIFWFWPKHEPSRKDETEAVQERETIEQLADGEIRQVRCAISPCFRAVFAPSCRRALLAGLDFHVYLWHLENDSAGNRTGGAIGQLKGHTARPMSFAFSRDECRALSGGMDNSVRLWDLEQRRLLRTFENHTSWVRGVDFVAETGLAISGDNHGRVLLWDARDGRLIHSFVGHEAVVFSIMASRSGRLAVSTSDDRTVRVWDLPLMHEAHCLRGHEGRTTCAVLSEDDRLVVSGSVDQTVRVWDVETEQTRWVLHGHTATVNVVAISADGRRVLSADRAGVIRLWDLQNGAELRVYKMPDAQVILAVAFCPDRRQIVSSGDDGIFRFWRLP